MVFSGPASALSRNYDISSETIKSVHYNDIVCLAPGASNSVDGINSNPSVTGYFDESHSYASLKIPRFYAPLLPPLVPPNFLPP